MSTAISLPLMTVEQFDELPEPQGDFTYELHFGDLVKVSNPKHLHYRLQLRIQKILERAIASENWQISIEMPYGLIPGFDARRADVGVCPVKVFESVPDDGSMIGSPTLVVEIKSRSNRDRSMECSALDHLTHSAAAVLLVKPERSQVIMLTALARTVHNAGETLTLPAPLNIALSVSEIFPE